MMEALQLDFVDNVWPFEYTDHDRSIARAIVFDEEGYLYFVRAERDDDFGKASVIETAGGGVEAGEEPVDAVIREVKEELGAEAEVLCEIGVVSDYYNLIHRHNINHYFLCRLCSLGEKSLTEDEIEKYHLSNLRLRPEDALKEYEQSRDSSLGRLIAQREMPILNQAIKLLNIDNH